jgi:hypothetical protein
MIQIGGLVHEFYVGKTQKEYNNRHGVPITDCHEDSRYRTNKKKKIREFTNWLYPFKPIIRKKVGGLDV